MRLGYRALAQGLFVFGSLLLIDALLSTPAVAGSNTEARLALHLLSPTTKAACTRAAAAPPCSNIVTNGNLAPTGYFAYLLVTNADAVAGIAGLQCGIQYNGAANAGVEVFSWTNCATLDFQSGGWPASGGGNLITWDSNTRCQRGEPGGAGTGVVATAGYFYVTAYTPDRMEITTRPVDGFAKVGSCSALESVLEGGAVHHNPSFLGYADFSAGAVAPGYNPCSGALSSIDCTISGPGSVPAGTSGIVYSADAAPAGSAYQWSVTGNGHIDGSTKGPSISVSTSGIGPFTVFVTVSQGGSENNCQRTVTVTGAIDCTISGPSSVFAGSTGNSYSAGAAPVGSTFQWSAGGNASIVGSTTGTSVSVTAGAEGTFSLTVVVTQGVGQSTCSRVVAVVAPTCQISGPGAPPANQPASYSATTNLPLPQFAWSVTGDATLGAPGPSGFVNVLVGGPGTFELSVVITSTVGQTSCSRTITIPGSIDCSISGAASLFAGSTGSIYAASAVPAGTTFQWSLAGNGSIVGSTTGSSVSVTAGAAGAFTLTVVATRGVEQNTCNRTVTVVAPTCQIDGPDPAAANYPALYSATTNLSSPQFAWSVTGNATLGAPAAPGFVNVLVGAPGAFELSVVITSADGQSACSRTLSSVTAPVPTCSILGPDQVTEGSIAQTYTVVSPDAVQSVNWSITGNGTITSSLFGNTITVTAGDPGGYELTATVHTVSPAAGACMKSVTVNPITCAIQGPNPVLFSTSNLAYTTGNPLAGATYAWSIAGNGTIVGSAQNANVSVTSGFTGAFVLNLTITRSGIAHACSRTISVVTSGGGGGGNSQSNAKILLHLTTPTTKVACTRAEATPPCGGVRTNGSLFPALYYANLLVVDGSVVPGLGGLQCGISYTDALHTGVDVFSWTLCATLEFPSTGWPQSGGGNLITWDTANQCQRTEPGGAGTGVVATAGYFYLAAYSPDLMAVTPRPVDGQAKLADCTARETLIGGTGYPGFTSHLGSANFTGGGTSPGYNPCGSFHDPVVPSTWSAIKALYGSEPVAKSNRKP